MPPSLLNIPTQPSVKDFVSSINNCPAQADRTDVYPIQSLLLELKQKFIQFGHLYDCHLQINIKSYYTVWKQIQWLRNKIIESSSSASLRWDGAPHISLRCVRFAGESDNIRLEFPRLWCRVGGWTSTLTLGGATELWFCCKWRLRSELFIFFDVLQSRMLRNLCNFRDDRWNIVKECH